MVFYAQSTGTVISGRDRQTDRQTDRERERERERERQRERERERGRGKWNRRRKNSSMEKRHSVSVTVQSQLGLKHQSVLCEW